MHNRRVSHTLCLIPCRLVVRHQRDTTSRWTSNTKRRNACPHPKGRFQWGYSERIYYYRVKILNSSPNHSIKLKTNRRAIRRNLTMWTILSNLLFSRKVDTLKNKNTSVFCDIDYELFHFVFWDYVKHLSRPGQKTDDCVANRSCATSQRVGNSHQSVGSQWCQNGNFLRASLFPHARLSRSSRAPLLAYFNSTLFIIVY